MQYKSARDLSAWFTLFLVRPARALNTETRDLVGGERREAAERVLEKPALAPQEGESAEAELEAEGSARDA